MPAKRPRSRKRQLTDQQYLRLLGRKVRLVRSYRRLSQQAVADAASISRSQLHRIERGKGNARILDLRRLADALQVSLAELVEH